MKRFKNVLLLLLAIATVLCAFGCGEKNQPSDQSTEITTERPAETGEYAEYLSSFETVKYEEIREFEVAVPEVDTGSYFCLSCEETPNGAQVHDSLLSRDNALYELHGIDVRYRGFPANDDGKTLRQTVQNEIMSDLETSDMIGGGLNYCIIPLNDLGLLYPINNAPYVTFEYPWWASYFIDSVTYRGKVTYASSMALGPGFFGAPYSMICNLNLQKQGIYLPDGTPMDIFELVESGEWTLDVFYDIIRDYSKDLNSDGKISPLQDLLAYAYVPTTVTACCHYFAAGMKLSEKDAEGNLVVNLAEEKVVNCVDRLQTIFASVSDNSNWDATYWENQLNIFKQDHALFFGNSMTYLSGLVEMHSDYAIIPLPKADAEQKSYYTGINTWTSAYIAVPKRVADPKFLGQSLELMGYYSWKYVRPVVYDRVISLRLARDERQLAIMDVIYSTLYTDLNFIHNFAGSADILATCVMDANQSYATKIAGIKETLPIKLQIFDRDMKKAYGNDS